MLLQFLTLLIQFASLLYDKESDDFDENAEKIAVKNEDSTFAWYVEYTDVVWIQVQPKSLQNYDANIRQNVDSKKYPPSESRACQTELELIRILGKKSLIKFVDLFDKKVYH